MQGFALFLFSLGLVVLQRPTNGNSKESKYDNTQEVASQFGRIQSEAAQAIENNAQGPPLPVGGLPAGWTMEQWEYYGHEYVDENGGGAQ